jgi:hypothetical protein
MLISAHASGYRSNFILGQRRITPTLIHYQQRRLDFYGIQSVPAHCAGQTCQSDVAPPFGDGRQILPPVLYAL